MEAGKMSMRKGATIPQILMVNIKTGEKKEARGMAAAGRMTGLSVCKVQRYIDTGKADSNGWTFDIEDD